MLRFLNSIFLNEKHLYFAFLIFILLIWQFKKKLFSNKFLKFISIILSLLILFIALLKTIANYFVWLNHPFSKNLLPPYTPITYFVRYSFQHYFFAPIVTIIFAYFIFWIIFKFNQKFEKTFFYEEEPYLSAMGILSVGWPNCLFYLSLVLLLGVISHLFFIVFNFILLILKKRKKLKNIQEGNEQVLNKQSRAEDEVERQFVISSSEELGASFRLNYLRLSLLYFWLPCALLVLIISDIISKWSIIQYFRI